jgi:hypothetical protein
MQHEGDDDENNAPATHSALHAARETERRGSAAADKKKEIRADESRNLVLFVSLNFAPAAAIGGCGVFHFGSANVDELLRTRCMLYAVSAALGAKSVPQKYSRRVIISAENQHRCGWN